MLKIIKNKKGMIQFFAPLLWALGNVWVLLGIGIFLLIVVGMSFFMLGKILGVALALLGAIGFLRGADTKMAIFLILAGVFVFLNPFHWETLQMMR